MIKSSMNSCVTRLAVLASVAFTVFQANAESLEDKMVYKSDLVSGIAVSEYANMWWQWAYSMPKDISPVRDNIGEHCHVGQSGDVWFLAGGFGSSKISRKCTIPADKYLFFPVINMAYWPRKNNGMNCEKVKRKAALNNDELLTIEIELDGVVAWNPADTRIASSECFNLLERIPTDVKKYEIYPTATDGYWVMLKPLKTGSHTLKFNAQYNRDKGAYSKMAQDIEYELSVE